MCSAGCGAKTKAFNIWPGTGASIQLVLLTGSARRLHTRCIEQQTHWKSWLNSRQKRINKTLDAFPLDPKRDARQRKAAVGARLKNNEKKVGGWAVKQGLQIQGKTCQNKGTNAFGRWPAQLNARFKPQQAKTCWLMPYEESKQSKSSCSCKAGWPRTQQIHPCSIGFVTYWSNEEFHEVWQQGFYLNCMRMGSVAETRNRMTHGPPCASCSFWIHSASRQRQWRASSSLEIEQRRDRHTSRTTSKAIKINSTQNKSQAKEKQWKIKEKKTRQRHCSSSYQNTKRNKKEATSWTCEGASITYKKGDQMDLNSWLWWGGAVSNSSLRLIPNAYWCRPAR